MEHLTAMAPTFGQKAGDDGDGTPGGERLRRQSPANTPHAAEDAFVAEGLLERLGLRLGRHSARDDVARDVSCSAGGDAAMTCIGECADLRAIARDAVSAALRAEQHGGAGDREVRKLLRAACHVAHSHDARVERLLIVLKEVWRELPQARHRTHTEAQAPLARAVTLCIEEYYATMPPRR